MKNKIIIKEQDADRFLQSMINPNETVMANNAHNLENITITHDQGKTIISDLELNLDFIE